LTGDHLHAGGFGMDLTEVLDDQRATHRLDVDYAPDTLGSKVPEPRWPLAAAW
jgi:hypothetical protein